MLLIMTVPTGESLALSGQESEMLDILLYKGQSYTMTGHSTSYTIFGCPTGHSLHVPPFSNHYIHN